jgi:hypothetical protein
VILEFAGFGLEWSLGEAPKVLIETPPRASGGGVSFFVRPPSMPETRLIQSV